MAMSQCLVEFCNSLLSVCLPLSGGFTQNIYSSDEEEVEKAEKLMKAKFLDSDEEEGEEAVRVRTVLPKSLFIIHILLS